MFKVMVPIAAVLLYVPVFFGHLVPTIIGAVTVFILGLASCGVGLAVNYRSPRLAAFAIGGWTVAWIVVLAAVCVGAAWAGVRIKDASPATANASTKLFAALGAAALAAIIAWLLDGRPMLTGGGIAKRCLKNRFAAWFPSQPQTPERGIEAYRAVSHAFVTAQPKEWSRQFRSTLFQKVKAAMDVGGYFGGSAWKDAEPPRQNPHVAAVATSPPEPHATAPPAPPPNTEGQERGVETTGEHPKR